MGGEENHAVGRLVDRRGSLDGHQSSEIGGSTQVAFVGCQGSFLVVVFPGDVCIPIGITTSSDETVPKV